VLQEEELTTIGTHIATSVSEAIKASVTGMVLRIEEVSSKVDGIGKAMTLMVETASGVQQTAMAITAEAEQGARATYISVAGSQSELAMAIHAVAMECTQSRESQVYIDINDQTESDTLSQLEEGILLQKGTLELKLMALEEGETRPDSI